MGSGSLEQSPVDGLSPGVLLVIIQQVFIEWRMQADLQVSGERNSWQWEQPGRGPRQTQPSNQGRMWEVRAKGTASHKGPCVLSRAETRAATFTRLRKCALEGT